MSHVNTAEYFAVLYRMRDYYPRLHDQYLLLAMLVLEDVFEDHILNIAADPQKLFHFTRNDILKLEKK